MNKMNKIFIFEQVGLLSILMNEKGFYFDALSHYFRTVLTIR